MPTIEIDETYITTGQHCVVCKEAFEAGTKARIWRLPGGGSAVGRFSGGRRGSERDLPMVYTETDGGFNSGGLPRRVSWSSRSSRGRDRGGFRRVFSNLFACFGGRRSSTSSSGLDTIMASPASRIRSFPNSRRTTPSRRCSSWSMDVNNGALDKLLDQ